MVRQVSISKIRNMGFLFLSGFVLISCASDKAIDKKYDNKPKNKEDNSIISQPLKDIGFMKKNIPPALAQITDPYATPQGIDCNYINYQITQLDEVLGPEKVRDSNIDDRTIGEKSGAIASSAASEAVKSAATSWIPARGLVRKITGAEKADNSMKKAVELGKIRRGYLRGLAKAKNCE